MVAMVLLALGLSSITAPTAEAVMGSVSDEQRGAAAGVNNTTRELGGTLGVAVFGSIFASSYAPKIISAFRPLPIPAGPKAEAHQSMAAALAVVGHAPQAAQPALQSIAFTAFHSGLQVACIAGAGVAVLGALAACRLLPGRGAPEVELAGRAGVHDPDALSGVRAVRHRPEEPHVGPDGARAATDGHGPTPCPLATRAADRRSTKRPTGRAARRR